LTETNEDLKDMDKPLTSTVFWKKCRISGVVTYYCSHILLSMGLVQIEGRLGSRSDKPHTNGRTTYARSWNPYNIDTDTFTRHKVP